jgi:hypothetical protein
MSEFHLGVCQKESKARRLENLPIVVGLAVVVDAESKFQV